MPSRSYRPGAMDGPPPLDIMKDLFFLAYSVANHTSTAWSTLCSALTCSHCGLSLLAMSAATHLSVGDELLQSRATSFKLRASFPDTTQLGENSKELISFLIIQTTRTPLLALNCEWPGQCLRRHSVLKQWRRSLPADPSLSPVF